MLALWVFGWEVTRIKFCRLIAAKSQRCTCQSAPGSACFTERTFALPTHPRERKPYIWDEQDRHLWLFAFSFFRPQIFMHMDSPGSLMKLENHMFGNHHNTVFNLLALSSSPSSHCTPKNKGLSLKGHFFQEVSWSVLCYSLPPNKQSRASSWSIFCRPQPFFPDHKPVSTL